MRRIRRTHRTGWSAVDRRLNRPELTTADVRDGIRKAWVVEHVVCIRSETQAHVLGNRNILQETQIRVEVVWPTEGVPRNVAESSFFSKARELRRLQALSRARSWTGTKKLESIPRGIGAESSSCWRYAGPKLHPQEQSCRIPLGIPGAPEERAGY